MVRGDRADSGKIAELGALLAAYEGEVAADLRRFYAGLDLRDLWRPGGGASRLTYRHLDDLIAHLPPESALKSAMRDDEDPAEVARLATAAVHRPGYGTWSRTDLLLAEVIDRLGDIGYRVVRVHSSKVKAPAPYPRPGVVRKEDRAHTAEHKAGVARIEAERAIHRENRARWLAEQQQQAEQAGPDGAGVA